MRGDHLRRGVGLINPPRWRVAAPPDPALAQSLAAATNLPLPLARILVQRGFSNPDLARDYLRPRLESLADPRSLRGLAAAVERISAAVANRETILVHGDYDVDGQCAAALLTRALRVAGASVHPFVPHRMDDGYDFGPAGVAEAQRIGATLVLTCDCGITAVEAVRTARDAGIDVLVTDHHLPGPELPEAVAIVDPQHPDDHSGLRMLCGTGIAFKLVQALVAPLGLPPALPWHLLDLVALATIADVVPLVGENRILVKHGLKLLADSRWAGLRALVAQLDLKGELRASQVGFILAPRLNAVGRIADAKDGLRLLLTDDNAEAAALAARLESLNQQRQQLDQRILDQALAIVERDYADPDAHRALVIAGEGWHPGVVGIVASRVVERFGRPTFLIGINEGVAKGSGRSIDRFDLHAALHHCADLLERFGGHRMAAGLTIAPTEINAFRERFNQVARDTLAPADLGPTQRVDLELDLIDVTDELERWSRQLEPCGMGNPGAVFGVRGARLERSRVVGNNHLKATLTHGSRQLETIAFNWADRVAGFGDGPVDAAFRLERNEWNGRSVLQACTVAFAPSDR